MNKYEEILAYNVKVEAWEVGKPQAAHISFSIAYKNGPTPHEATSVQLLQATAKSG
jgi:hypothetical protein